MKPSDHLKSTAQMPAAIVPASVPFRAVLISVLALWLTYFILATLRWEIIAGTHSLEMAQLRAIVVAGGVVVTLFLWLLLRLFDARPYWMKALAAALLILPVSVLLAQINNSVFSEMNQTMEKKQAKKPEEGSGNLFPDAPIPPSSPEAPPLAPPSPMNNDAEGGRAGDQYASDTQEALAEPVPDEAKKDKGPLGFLEYLTELTFSRYFMMLAWSAIYFSMLAIAQARIAERREQMFRNAAKAAELRSLRYQVNPHFLFNTLSSLSALVMTGKVDQAELMIQMISSFYRHSLTNEPTSDVALEQEFELQQHYLNIEEVRFPERLKTEFTLPADLADARVPGMILQPLVENSVKYAVSAISQPVTVQIEAREDFDRLVITVTDNGPGIPAGMKHGFGIGLANVRDRLEARFGGDVSLSSGPIEGGYRSEIRIPLTRNG